MSKLTQGYLGSRRKILPGLQSVTITNPDATSATSSNAYKRDAAAGGGGQGDIEHSPKSATWFVWKADLSSFVPKKDGYLTDSASRKWYIDDVQLTLLDSRFELTCTLQAGTSGVGVMTPG